MPVLTERMVAQLWNDLAFDLTDLKATNNAPLQIVYRGRWSYGNGPDFQKAIISIPCRRLLNGDVEIHVRSSDWFAHGHHTDHHYDSVVLHVVVWDDVTRPIANSKGELILTLCLESRLPEENELERYEQLTPLGAISGRSCWSRAVSVDDARIGPLLDELGDRRFADKVTCFEGELSCSSPDQVLYASVLDALGYSANREPFRRLAASLSIEELRTMVGGSEADDRTFAAQAALFGVAGLLPSQSEDSRELDWLSASHAEELEGLWFALAPSHGGPILSRSDWSFNRLRPANFPTRRVAAAAHLFDAGLFDSTALASFPVDEQPYRLARRLRLNWTVGATNDIWSTHADFGFSFSARRKSLIGSSRAADIVLNAVLPFTTALATLEGKPAVEAAAKETYCNHPRLSDNELVHATALQVLGDKAGSIVNCARRQQGLLYIYKNYCADVRCYECPVSDTLLPS
jgi:Protein of unknown function (DUF2851)